MNNEDKVLGLKIVELAEVRKKLQVLGLDLIDVIEFLDRDNAQLFAEMKVKIKSQELKIQQIKGRLLDMADGI